MRIVRTEDSSDRNLIEHFGDFAEIVALFSWDDAFDDVEGVGCAVQREKMSASRFEEDSERGRFDESTLSD